MDLNTLILVVLVVLGALIASILTSWRNNKRWEEEIEDKGLTFLPDNPEWFLKARPIYDEHYVVHRRCLLEHFNTVESARGKARKINELEVEQARLINDLEEAQADNEQLKKDIKKWEDLATGKPLVVDLKS